MVTAHIDGMALKELRKNKVKKLPDTNSLYTLKEDHNIIIRSNKQENCLQREVKNYTIID